MGRSVSKQRPSASPNLGPPLATERALLSAAVEQVAVYQLGIFEALGWPPLQTSGGALFWMSPCIAFAIVVGLGLDYDVFFMESVVEQHDRGATTKQAVVGALAHTGHIICAAGVIMALAFGALLVGRTPALNQIGFLLVPRQR